MAQSAQMSFFISQLAHIEPEILQIQYADLQWPELIPVDDSAWDWAPRITWFSGDGTGEPAEISSAADDIPLANISAESHDVMVSMFALGFGYTEAEIQAALRLGMNLNSQNAQNVRRNIDEQIEDLIWNGNSNHGWNSFLNETNIVDRSDAANNAAGNSREWKDKTPKEILRDINNLISGMRTDTNRVEIADTLCLPPKACDQLAWDHLPNTDRSLWSYIEENNVYTNKTGRMLNIFEINELDSVAAGNTGRIIAYRRAPDVLKFHMPLPFSFFNPRQKSSMQYVVDGIYRTGGLEIRRPGAMRYLDGISTP